MQSFSPITSIQQVDRPGMWATVRDIIAVTSGSPQSPRTPLGWFPVTCRRHLPVVYIISVDSDPRRENPPHLLQTPEPISN